MVRVQVLRLVSLPLWQALSPGRLQLELHALPQLGKHWKHLLKKEQKVRVHFHACERARVRVCVCAPVWVRMCRYGRGKRGNEAHGVEERRCLRT